MFTHYPVTFSLLGSNVLFSTLVSKTLIVTVSCQYRTHILYTYPD